MPTEILYANLTIQDGKTIKVIKDVVYKHKDGFYHNRKMFKEPVKVLKVEKIKSLGFDCEYLGYQEVKKSDEKRNEITGAYE
jgi:glucan biosynthesis protein